MSAEISANPIHPEFAKIYQDFINSLEPDKQNLKVEILGNIRGTFTRRDLARHVTLGDEIGREWSEIIFKGIYSGLTHRNRLRADADPEFLIQKTIAHFQESIEAHTYQP